jgi:chaperonin cofactor prefoldin
MSNYRVDQRTGAVIFHKTPEQKKALELEQRVAQLEKEVEFLKKSQRRKRIRR